jgi:kynurenine formamidase
VVIVERLTNPEPIPLGRIIFVGLPLKVEKSDGTPIQAVAIVPSETRIDP